MMKKKSSIVMLIVVIFLSLGIVGYNNPDMNNKITSLFGYKSQKIDVNKPGGDNNKIAETRQTIPATVTPKTSTPNPKNTTLTKSTTAAKSTTITNKSTAKTQAKSIPVVKNTKIIVIDPGHGGTVNSEKEPLSPGSSIMKAKYATGATGIYTKKTEAQLNLEVSLKLAASLRNAGYKVIMTRTSNSLLSNIERAEIGNKNNANLVIRIHADGSSDHSVTGATTLVPGNVGYAKSVSAISKSYGSIIQKSLIASIKTKDRGVSQRTDLTGFNWSKVPVVLVEMGFLSNVNEDKLLSTSSYQDKIVKGLFDGINNAFK